MKYGRFGAIITERIWKYGKVIERSCFMTLDEMKRIKKEHGLTYEMIAERSGVPLGTVQKIFAGISKAPRYETLERLNRYFGMLDTRTIEERYDDYLKYHYIPPSEGREGVNDSVAAYTAVRDESAKVRWGIPYKEQGEYTKEDYFMIPDDFRVELINGVIYDMTAPTTVHQFLIGEVFSVFRDYFKRSKGTCVPLISPVDVELDEKKETIVQPDIMVLCKDRRKLLKKGRIYGAPDLVVEVLSPSTKKKDCTKKLHEYQAAGVREYWLIDPDEKRIIVYDFSAEICPVIYGFRDKIPVGLYNGDLVIDFAEIDDFKNLVYEDVPDVD